MEFDTVCTMLLVDVNATLEQLEKFKHFYYQYRPMHTDKLRADRYHK